MDLRTMFKHHGRPQVDTGNGTEVVHGAADDALRKAMQLVEILKGLPEK